jgi:hypothetical protein
MNRLWYLSRNGQVFGPVTDAQLMQSAAAGHVLPTDQLNLAGQPTWWPATSVPGLLNPLPAPIPAPVGANPAVATVVPLSLDPDPVPVDAVDAVEVKCIRTTCFACFNEVSLEFEAGTPTVHCPQCRSALETGETASATAAPAEAQAAFGKLESAKAFKARMQKKVADAHARDARDAAIAGGILGALNVLGNS